MRYQTDLMRAILTNETAQKMIDYVSPIYGNSYVGLWLFQAMGTVMDDVYKLCEQMRYEANPATSTLLLDQWEDHYRLDRAPHLTVEERRARLVAKMGVSGACNPSRLAAAVSAALGGVAVEVTENVSKNKFRVAVLESVESLEPAIQVINRMKPAHQIYDIQVEIRSVPTAHVKAAVAMTYAEMYAVQVIESETDPDGIYVMGETLAVNEEGASMAGETISLTSNLAKVNGETLIIK